MLSQNEAMFSAEMASSSAYTNLNYNCDAGASSSAYSTNSPKRRREGDSSELENHSSIKRRFADWYFSLPESLPALSGDESVYSMQAWETEFCQDTPDTSSDSSSDTDRVNDKLGIEYDVASLSEAEHPFGSSDSSTEDEDQISFTEIVVEVEKEEAIERECWGDDSDSDSASSDQELSQSDFWTCLRCKSINKPIPRFCIKCFQVRKNWFPRRPRHKGKKKTKNLKRKRSDGHDKDGVDSGFGSFSMGTNGNGECSANVNSESKSSELVSELPKKGNNSAEGTGVVSALRTDKCMTCMQEPKNAVFVHGTNGHLCCCYPCAKKVWSSSGKCPICNRKTNSVVKVFVA